MLKVWIPRPSGSAFEAALRRHVGDGVDLVFGGPRPDPPDYEVLVEGRPDAADVAEATDLRVLVVPYAGIPPATRRLMADHPDVAVHNLHHNAPATGELAIGLLLAAARRLVPADRALRRGDWRPRYEDTESQLVGGSKAAVVGYGAVGRHVARVLEALGADVHAVRRCATPGEGDVRVHGVDDLDAVLDGADVVVVCVPSTEATRGMFDAERLARLSDRTVFVNVSRGDVVDERALYEALRDRRLGAAGLDVWWRYPTDAASRENTPPSAFPFHELDNVVMSPHRGGMAGAIEAERARDLAVVLEAASRGLEAPWRVDLEAGY